MCRYKDAKQNALGSRHEDEFLQSTHEFERGTQCSGFNPPGSLFPSVRSALERGELPRYEKGSACLDLYQLEVLAGCTQESSSVPGPRDL